jgi:TIR domain
MSDHRPYVYDAFISCSPQDRSWVESILLPRLLASGLQVLVSSSLQNLDADNRQAIVERIGQARYVIAVLSPAALSNQQIQFEWGTALERNFLTGTYCLLPVKIASLDESQIPTQLAALATVDFTKPDKLEMAFAYLLSIWKR